MDSPIPKAMRSVNSKAKVCAMPVNAVAADQSRKPPARTQPALNRSTTQPEMFAICRTA